MESSTYKYSQYLLPITNCPGHDCIERDRNAFRWVHSTPTSEDFIPLPLLPKVTMRPIDETDFVQHCSSYGLSLWDTFELAKAKFIAAYNRQPPPLKAQYIVNKGDSVAFLNLEKKHGVSSESNKYGHFTLHEYIGIDLKQEIKQIYNIFE